MQDHNDALYSTIEFWRNTYAGLRTSSVPVVLVTGII